MLGRNHLPNLQWSASFYAQTFQFEIYHFRNKVNQILCGNEIEGDKEGIYS